MARLAKGKVGRLTRRAEFLAVAGARRKWAAAGLLVQARAHDERQHPAPGQAPVRVGLTASKKVGGAVDRNRARRRLRAALAEVLADNAVPHHDYVLVARAETVRRPYAALKRDMEQALRKLKAWRGPADAAPTAGPAAAPADSAGDTGAAPDSPP